MYHIDPNLNTALERQAERVRAIRAVGQTQPREPAAAVWLNTDRPSHPQRGRRRRWWPAVAVLLIGLALALVAWTGTAHGAVRAWGW